MQQIVINEKLLFELPPFGYPAISRLCDRYNQTCCIGLLAKATDTDGIEILVNGYHKKIMVDIVQSVNIIITENTRMVHDAV